MSTTTGAQPSIMHSLKTSLFHGEKHVDADYEAALAKFTTLDTNLHKLKSDTSNYNAAIYSVFLHSNNNSVGWSTLLDDANLPNPYQTLSRENRNAHHTLNSEKGQVLTTELSEQVLRPIDAEIKANLGLHQRITRRNELHAELEYYLNKVHDLNKEATERSSKGKTESKSNLEKMDRNQAKLNQCRDAYTSYTSVLMADLLNAWKSRVEVLGPALASFVQIERKFVQLYATELSTVNRAEVLRQAPPEVAHVPLTAEDVPRPVVAGDMHVVPSPAHAHTSLGVASVYQATAPPVPSDPTPYKSQLETSASPIQQPIQQETSTTIAAGTNQRQSSEGNPFEESSSTSTLLSSQEGAQPMANPDPQATTAAVERDVMVDPTSVLHTESGYSDQAAPLAGLADSQAAKPPQEQDILGLNNNNATTKNAFENESKAQRFEQDSKAQSVL